MPNSIAGPLGLISSASQARLNDSLNAGPGVLVDLDQQVEITTGSHRVEALSTRRGPPITIETVADHFPEARQHAMVDTVG